MTTSHDETLCLGKTPGGKPNGCERADSCWHHIEIKRIVNEANYCVKNRICSEHTFDYYIPAVKP